MVRNALLYRKPRGRARQFLLWSTCSQFNFCSEMNDAMRFSVRKPRVRARRKPCISHTIRIIICHLEHVLCIKTCTHIGTFKRFRLGGVSAITAEHALRNMCTSRINCNIHYGVNIGHPIVARNGVQDKLHLAPQDKMTALRTAKTLSPLVLFSIWRGPPSYG